MNRPTLLVVASLAAAALVPATASAASSSSVTSHIHKSQGAQHRVATLIHRGQTSSAKRVLKVARHEAVAAARDAKSLAANADTSQTNGSQAAASLAAAAQNYGDALSQWANLVPDAAPLIQQLLANAIPGTVAGRDQLIQQLTDLAKELQGNAQSIAAQALAALQVALPTQVGDLGNLANMGDLPTSISSIINQALAAATSMLDNGLSTLTGLIPSLPDGVQAPITQALGLASQLIEGIAPILTQTTSLVSNLISQVMGNFTNILGGLFGSTGDSSSSSSSSSSTGPLGGLGGLISSITGMLPNIGSIFSGLLGGGSGGGILGGLLGGHA